MSASSSSFQNPFNFGNSGVNMNIKIDIPGSDMAGGQGLGHMYNHSTTMNNSYDEELANLSGEHTRPRANAPGQPMVSNSCGSNSASSGGSGPLPSMTDMSNQSSEAACGSTLHTAQLPEWKLKECAAAPCNLDRNYLCLYLCALAGFSLFWQSFHDIGLSTLITVAVLIQVIALAALLIGILGRQSVKGLSCRSMGMQAVSFFLRLCSTCWLKGYIPVDSTGDWLYQLADFTALLLCLRIVYLTMYSPLKHTYQKEQDSFAAVQTVIACFILAILIHPDLNNRPFFDSVWTASLYVDVVSTLPQLWMIGRLGGKVDALSAHYVALIALSRGVDAIFWYYGFEELAPENGSFNLAGWTVLGAHLLHLLLMWDFIYCYCRSIYRGKLLDRQFDFGDLIDV